MSPVLGFVLVVEFLFFVALILSLVTTLMFVEDVADSTATQKQRDFVKVNQYVLTGFTSFLLLISAYIFGRAAWSPDYRTRFWTMLQHSEQLLAD